MTYMFQPHANRLIREAQHSIDDQRARLQRMIVQGSPTQSTDDRLNKLCETLRQLRGANARLPPFPNPGARRFSVTEPERQTQ
jgi:hypothetical protein